MQKILLTFVACQDDDRDPEWLWQAFVRRHLQNLDVAADFRFMHDTTDADMEESLGTAYELLEQEPSAEDYAFCLLAVPATFTASPKDEPGNKETASALVIAIRNGTGTEWLRIVGEQTMNEDPYHEVASRIIRNTIRKRPALQRPMVEAPLLEKICDAIWVAICESIRHYDPSLSERAQ